MNTNRKPKAAPRHKNTWNPKAVPAAGSPPASARKAKSEQTASPPIHAHDDALPNPPSVLPRLIDRKTLEKQVGIAPSTVEVFFKTLPVFRHPKQRKPYLYESDVMEEFARHTHMPTKRSVR